MYRWFSERSRTIRWGISICFALLMSLFVWKPALSGGFSLRDDHDIVATVGQDNDLGISEALDSLAETELARYGETLRFRPTYWIAKRIECAAWENEVQLWRCFRFLVAAGFTAVLTFFLLNYLSFSIGILTALMILSGVYWADIFATLGTSEFYGVFGMTGVLLGYLVGTRHFGTGLILAGAGIVFAIGVKENFLATPLLLLPFYFLARDRRHLGMVIAALLLSLFWALFVLLGFLPHVLRAEHDLYGNSIWLSERLAKFISPVLIATFASVIVYFAIEDKPESGRLFRNLLSRPGVVVLTILFVLLLFNVVFYGEIPSDNRYAFPAFPLGVAIVALTLDRLNGRIPNRLRIFLPALLILMAIVPVARGFTELRETTVREVATNAALDAFIDKIAIECNNRQLIPVIVIDGREPVSQQYETAHALAIYLSARMRAEGGIPVTFDNVSEIPDAGFERDLFEGLRRSLEMQAYFATFPSTASPVNHFAVLIRGSTRAEYGGILVWNDFKKVQKRLVREKRKK